MGKAVVAVLLSVAACGGGGGGGPDDTEAQQQAQQVYLASYGESINIQQSALAAFRIADVTETLDFTQPCTGGGSGTVHGLYDDGGGNGPDVTFTLDLTFADCTEGTDSFHGTEHWTKIVEPTSDDTEMVDSYLEYDGATFAATFELHLTTRLDVGAGQITYSGTFLINGRSYTLDTGVW